MTSIWGVSKTDGGPPSAEDVAEVMKHIPAFQFMPRPVPQEYNIISQQAEGLQDEWTAKGLYCPGCFTVSKDLGRFSSLGSRSPTEEQLYIQWELRLQSLIQAAETGCQLCSFFAVRFFNDPGHMYMRGNKPSRNPIGCCGSVPVSDRFDAVGEAIAKIRGFSEKYTDPTFTLIAQPLDYSVNQQGRGGYGKLLFQFSNTSLPTMEAVEEILGYRREIIIEVHAGDVQTSNFIQYLPLLTSLAWPPESSIVQHWMEACASSHAECPSPVPQPLPTRLVEIVDEHNLRLCSGTNVVGQYVTLSYCWGGPQDFATTEERLHTLEDGFLVSQLPQTLQDAIAVTSSVGMKYLWVDSLCIIQDSEKDKSTELPRMTSYYKNAYVTVCAGGNKSSSGFLKKESTCENHPSAVPSALLGFPFLCPNGQTGGLLFHEESPYAVSDEPVSSRAWTFQEMALSPRVLFYGDRLVWQCHSAQHSAGGVEDWDVDLRSQGNRKLHLTLGQNTASSASDSPRQESTPNKHKLYDMWHRAVKEYSYRALTFEEDKLPAISGLASEFSALTGDEYLAGLWRSNFLRGLLWSTYPKATATRSKKWRAPTWSWASTTDVVSYDRLPPEYAVELGQVVDVGVKPKPGPVPFVYGEITSAHLVIKGPVIREQSDMAYDLLEQDNRLPRQDKTNTTAWRRNMADIISTRRFASSSKTMDFKLPKSTILLALFAAPVTEGIKQDGGGQALEAADNEALSGAETESGEATKVAPPEHTEDKGEDARVIIYGLVLGENEDGSFHRIGRFTTPRLTGHKFLTAREESIRIS